MSIEIAPAASAAAHEVEPELVATFNRWDLQQEGKTDIWLDILPGLVGPQDVAASQAYGLRPALEELLRHWPTARITVDAAGSAVIYR